MKNQRFSFRGLLTAILMLIGIYLLNQGIAGWPINYYYMILGLLIIIIRMIWQHYILNYLEDRRFKWHRDNMIFFGASNFFGGIIIMDKVLNNQQWLERNWLSFGNSEIKTLFLAFGFIFGLSLIFVGLRCALTGASDEWYKRYLNTRYP